MGKGMLSIQPYYSERFLLSKVGMAGVIIFLTSLFDIKSTLLAKQHYFIYYLSLAMYPKFLFVVLIYIIPDQRQIRTDAIEHQSGSSSRCGGTSREAKEDNRISDTHVTSLDWVWGESRVSNRGIHTDSRFCVVKFHNIEKEPRLCGGGEAEEEKELVMNVNQNVLIQFI